MPKGAGKKRITLIPAIHGKVTRDGKVCEPDIHESLRGKTGKWL